MIDRTLSAVCSAYLQTVNKLQSKLTAAPGGCKLTINRNVTTIKVCHNLWLINKPGVPDRYVQLTQVTEEITRIAAVDSTYLHTILYRKNYYTV